MPLKRRLLTPGPTQVPEAALLRMARQLGHHRTPEFQAVFSEVQEGLKYLLQTSGDVIVLTSSGTGAMEAAMVNTVPRGGKAIVLDAGRFAQRWAKIAAAFGIEVVHHRTPWGQAVEPTEVAKLLTQHPEAAAVFGTLMESSTGVGHDVRAIAEVVRRSSALFVVDGISGAGVMECRTEAWGIDLLVVGSQKALMLPPGLAFIAVSERAWQQMAAVRPQAFYFDLQVHRRKLHEGADTPWTPAFTLVAGLAECIRELRARGIENIWREADLLGRATRAGFAALGLEIFAKRPASGMTAVAFPPGLDGARFLKRLEERFGVKLAGGQDELKGNICRIAHFGLIDQLDILGTLAAVELVLLEMGREVTLGAGVAAASAVFAG